MIQPALKDNAFLADLALAKESNESLILWWLGQSGYLIQYQGHRLLLDPYLSDSLTHKYADDGTGDFTGPVGGYRGRDG